MTLTQNPPTQPGPAPAAVATTQYLKICYFSKRRMMLEALAHELGCSWQSIALAAIDELLDREFSRKNHR
jgi:hypothetical protein